MSVWIGTSGWTYDGWRGPFYPDDVAKRRWLAWYATQFLSTEVNGSFYRTPSIDAVERWREETPQDFQFAWKASKFITHWKRLGPTSASSLELMESRLKVLGDKLGVVLFQLPARFKADLERLDSFLKLLPHRRRYAFEFRDASWYTDELLRLLKKRNVALCISDHHDAPAPWEATADHVYIRGHGPTGKYHGRYGEAPLKRWAEQIRRWKRGGREIYCYFDNDQKSAAPLDARRLTELLKPPSLAKRRRRRSTSR